jgi:hypothetical protein
MGWFGPDLPKRITKEEWVEVISSLYDELDERERIELEKFFRADLFEEGKEAGITAAEFATGMAWLRANMTKHPFESDDLDEIEESFAKHLKD